MTTHEQAAQPKTLTGTHFQAFCFCIFLHFSASCRLGNPFCISAPPPIGGAENRKPKQKKPTQRPNCRKGVQVRARPAAAPRRAWPAGSVVSVGQPAVVHLGGRQQCVEVHRGGLQQQVEVSLCLQQQCVEIVRLPVVHSGCLQCVCVHLAGTASALQPAYLGVGRSGLDSSASPYSASSH